MTPYSGTGSDEVERRGEQGGEQQRPVGGGLGRAIDLGHRESSMARQAEGNLVVARLVALKPEARSQLRDLLGAWFSSVTICFGGPPDGSM